MLTSRDVRVVFCATFYVWLLTSPCVASSATSATSRPQKTGVSDGCVSLLQTAPIAAARSQAEEGKNAKPKSSLLAVDTEAKPSLNALLEQFDIAAPSLLTASHNISSKMPSSLASAVSAVKDMANPPPANTEPIKEEIKERVADVIDKEVQKAAEDHRQPTKQELDDAVEDELDRIWSTLMKAHRHEWHAAADRPTGIVNFFESVQFYDWCLLFIAFVSFLLLYRYLLDWPSTKTFHSMALLIWIALATVYNFLIFGRLGARRGAMWSNGYLLEFIFLVENVFVFHIIVKAFRLPRYVTQKAIFIVVVCQIIFQMVFYMGLASWLRSFEVLPYILGFWLLYVAYQSAAEDDHDFNILESKPVLACKALLGDRLLLDGVNEEVQCDVFVKSVNGKVCVSTMGLMVMCLLMADFLLEIDVTLTKIELFPNQYICFSSSVVASFAVPELFFVAGDLFRMFGGLKYGISFVLFFFGMQMLMHDVFTLPALACILILVSVIVLSIVISVVMQWRSADRGHKEEGKLCSNIGAPTPRQTSYGTEAVNVETR